MSTNYPILTIIRLKSAPGELRCIYAGFTDDDRRRQHTTTDVIDHH